MPKFASLETLPEDARAVKNYNSHEFDELYYSPANKSFYQKTRTNRYKEINNKNNEDKQYVYARNNKNRSIRIKRLQKSLRTNLRLNLSNLSARLKIMIVVLKLT